MRKMIMMMMRSSAICLFIWWNKDVDSPVANLVCFSNVISGREIDCRVLRTLNIGKTVVYFEI